MLRSQTNFSKIGFRPQRAYRISVVHNNNPAPRVLQTCAKTRRGQTTFALAGSILRICDMRILNESSVVNVGCFAGFWMAAIGCVVVWFSLI